MHPLCEICGSAFANELHHRDGNPRNNDPSNFMALCKPDHSRLTRLAQLGLS